MQARSALVILLLATVAFAQEEHEATAAATDSPVSDSNPELTTEVTKEQGLLSCLVDNVGTTVMNASRSTKDFLKKLSPGDKILDTLIKIDLRFDTLNNTLLQTFEEIIEVKKACETKASATLIPMFCTQRARASYIYKTAKEVAFFAGDLTKMIISANVKFQGENVIGNVIAFIKAQTGHMSASIKTGVGCFFG